MFKAFSSLPSLFATQFTQDQNYTNNMKWLKTELEKYLIIKTFCSPISLLCSFFQFKNTNTIKLQYTYHTWVRHSWSCYCLATIEIFLFARFCCYLYIHIAQRKNKGGHLIILRIKFFSIKAFYRQPVS